MYYYGRDRQRRLRRRIRLAVASLAGLAAIVGLYFLFFSNKSALITQPEDLTSSEYTGSSDTIRTPESKVMTQSQNHAVNYYGEKPAKNLVPASKDKRLALAENTKRKSTGPVYEVVSVAHFYDHPSSRARRKDSINYWNESFASIKPITKKNGFVYVVFKYPQGQTAKGWLREKDLKEVNAAYENNKD